MDTSYSPVLSRNCPKRVLFFFFRREVPQAWGTLDRKSTFFKLIVNFFLKGVVFMFWHAIVYIELLYCVTNFELVWT